MRAAGAAEPACGAVRGGRTAIVEPAGPAARMKSIGAPAPATGAVRACSSSAACGKQQRDRRRFDFRRGALRRRTPAATPSRPPRPRARHALAPATPSRPPRPRAAWHHGTPARALSAKTAGRGARIRRQLGFTGAPSEAGLSGAGAAHGAAAQTAAALAIPPSSSRPRFAPQSILAPRAKAPPNGPPAGRRFARRSSQRAPAGAATPGAAPRRVARQRREANVPQRRIAPSVRPDITGLDRGSASARMTGVF